MLKRTLSYFILGICLFINPLLSAGSSDFGPEGTVYLAVNIHYQVHSHDNKASYANWTDPGEGHKILAVNTPVKIERWGRRGFKIIDMNTNTVVLFEYNKKRMEIPIEKYLQIITSPAKESLDNLSEADKKGIREGKLVYGMSKKGVMMALGYPATHRTPSLDSNTWVYWTNRFTTFEVNFNDKGLVQ